VARVFSFGSRRLRRSEELAAARLEYLLEALREAGQEDFVARAEAERRTRRTPVTELVDRCEEYAAVAGLKYVFKGTSH
jgi:hypothetical protein